MLTIFTITTQETTFTLTKTAEFNLCGYIMHNIVSKRNFPNFSSWKYSEGEHSREDQKSPSTILTYLHNSKFMYVEKHIKIQLTKLYTNIIEQKCALKKQILQNALSLSSVSLDEMAFWIMKTLDYTVVMVGEIIHLIKCVPVCWVRSPNVTRNYQ